MDIISYILTAPFVVLFWYFLKLKYPRDTNIKDLAILFILYIPISITTEYINIPTPFNGGMTIKGFAVYLLLTAITTLIYLLLKRKF